MKKFIFKQIACLKSVTLLKRKSFNKYFLNVSSWISELFSCNKFIYLSIYRASYLPTYLTTYLSTYLPLTLSPSLPLPPSLPTDQLTDRATNRSINLPIYLSIYIYIHIYISSFTTGSIVDKNMKKKNMILLEKPGSILLKYKNTTENNISS